jgi:putative membrane protein
MMVVREILDGSMSGLGNWIFMLMLVSVVTASVIGYVATIRSGRWMAGFISKVNVKKMNMTIIAVIAALVLLTTGLWGMAILAISAVIGMMPLGAGIGRVHLSGCLLIPVIFVQLGLDGVFLTLF